MAFAPAELATDRHPAVRAWLRVHPDRFPSSVAPSVPPEGSRMHLAVYRLEGVAPDGGAVVAKRERRDVIRLEHMVYAQILPSLGVDALACYGVVTEGAGDWLFLEEAAGVPFDEANPIHQEIAAAWFATLHTVSAGSAEIARQVPAQDALRYRTHIDRALRSIVASTSNPALSDDDTVVLARLVRVLTRMREGEVLEGGEHCLVHGDFSAKNAHVDARGGRLLLMDWQTVGWGSPAVDLFRIEPGAYRRHREASGSVLSVEQVQELRRSGTIARAVAAVDWGSGMLATRWVEHTMANMRGYLNTLTSALAGAPYRIGSLEL